jgi:hypothetical protein
MTFFESQLCIHERPCEICRAKELGLAFRRKMNPDNPDFDCRCGKPWNMQSISQATVETIIEKVKTLNDQSEKGLWLTAMVSQCLDTKSREDLTPCQKYHQDRKIQKYWNTYLDLTNAIP